MYLLILLLLFLAFVSIYIYNGECISLSVYSKTYTKIVLAVLKQLYEIIIIMAVFWLKLYLFICICNVFFVNTFWVSFKYSCIHGY